MVRTASSSSRAGAGAPAAAAAAPASAATLAKSLPLAARYVLLAAYFAAHNPPKSDVRMFVRVDETEGVARKGKKAKRKGGGAKAGGKGSPKVRRSRSLSTRRVRKDEADPRLHLLFVLHARRRTLQR